MTYFREHLHNILGYMPNCPECVVAMLATASLGAVWSSSSPDMGNMVLV